MSVNGTKRGLKVTARHAHEEISARDTRVASPAPHSRLTHRLALAFNRRVKYRRLTRPHVPPLITHSTASSSHRLAGFADGETCTRIRRRQQPARRSQRASPQCAAASTSPSEAADRGVRDGSTEAIAARSPPPAEHARVSSMSEHRDLAARRQSGALKRDCAGVLCSTAQSIRAVLHRRSHSSADRQLWLRDATIDGGDHQVMQNSLCSGSTTTANVSCR